jgi:hypothetical protein
MKKSKRNLSWTNNSSHITNKGRRIRLIDKEENKKIHDQ